MKFIPWFPDLISKPMQGVSASAYVLNAGPEYRPYVLNNKIYPGTPDAEQVQIANRDILCYCSGGGWGKASGDSAEEDLSGDLHSVALAHHSCHLAKALAGWNLLQWDGSGGRSLPSWLGSFPLLPLLLLLPPLPLQLVHSLLLLFKPGSPSPIIFLPSLPSFPLHSPALAGIPPKLLFHLLPLLLSKPLLLRLHNETLQGPHPLYLPAWLTLVSFICHLHILSKMKNERVQCILGCSSVLAQIAGT